MKKLILILGFICLQFAVFSQVSGFMGKRFIVSANGYFGPSIGRNVTPNSTRSGYFLNSKFSLGLDYVIGRIWSCGIEVQQTKTAIRLSIDDAIPLLEDANYQINSSIVAVNFTRYFSNSDFIAPVGRYITFGAMTINYTLVDNAGVVFRPNTKLAQGHNYGIFVGFGRKRVYYRKIMVDFALQSALVTGRPKPNPENNTHNFFDDIKGGLFAASLVNAKIGVGYLF